MRRGRRESGQGRRVGLGLLLQRRDRAADGGVVEQEVDDAAQVVQVVGGEGVLHEARGEQEFARGAERRGLRQARGGAGRQDEMGEPGVIFRREAQARFGRTIPGAAHEHAVDAVALAVGRHAIAREGQEHGDAG